MSNYYSAKNLFEHSSNEDLLTNLVNPKNIQLRWLAVKSLWFARNIDLFADVLSKSSVYQDFLVNLYSKKQFAFLRSDSARKHLKKVLDSMIEISYPTVTHKTYDRIIVRTNLIRTNKEANAFFERVSGELVFFKTTPLKMLYLVRNYHKQ